MRNSNLFFIAFLLIFISCEKQEGEGGTSTIKGKVIIHLVSDDFQTPYATFPDEDQDVYIMYGSDDFFSDETETHYDGIFRFQNLRKGDYKVYSYSADTTGQSLSGKVPIIKDVKIEKNGTSVEAPTIEIYKQVTSYEGSSTIEGKVFAYDWNSDLTILKDSFYLRNEYVYLARAEDNYYFERQRTFYDGSFVFTSLPIGNYEIYVYSRDITGQDPQDEVPIIVLESIESNKQHINIGRIEIIN